ncbi:MAG: polyprenyl synthetase family protein [Pyrinomonadaceae bacterium]
MKASPEILTPPDQTAAQADFLAYLAAARARVDAELDRLLPAETVAPTKVHRAIRWSVFAGGKRFRPILLLATGETFGATAELLLSTACALEMIHTYSLVHDDLPSMDNDDLRRGQPTCHVRFDEATAILAGDALQTLAFQTIAEDEQLSPQTRVKLVSELARASGTPIGMVAGQARDLDAESRIVSGDELEQIHRLKTGALIIAAARCGGIIAGANKQQLESVSHYASQLGLLFQITDDMLDVTATAEDLGKTPGKDARSQKATYPSIYGIDAAQERADRTHERACSVLEQIDRPTQRLRAIADFILERTA